MINRRHPDINILPPPINNWITVCPYERCPISWARIPSIISSESKSNPSVMHSVCLPRANAFGAGSWIIFTFTFLGQYDVFSFALSKTYGALIYLENFAPDEARERFEERIRSLFETKWIIELVDMAMLKIREYPDKGALYCEIISKAYLNRFKYKESEMLEVLNMERSSYYDRKKEAILLFGLSLWGTAIPKLKDFLESAREEEALCYCEC